MFVRAILGINADVPRNELLFKPTLPEWLQEITITNFNVGDQRLAIRFTGVGPESRFEVLENPSGIGVNSRQLRGGMRGVNGERCTTTLAGILDGGWWPWVLHDVCRSIVRNTAATSSVAAAHAHSQSCCSGRNHGCGNGAHGSGHHLFPLGQAISVHLNPAANLTFYVLHKIASWDAVFHILRTTRNVLLHWWPF
jgi:hypothetical protein